MKAPYSHKHPVPPGHTPESLTVAMNDLVRGAREAYRTYMTSHATPDLKAHVEDHLASADMVEPVPPPAEPAKP